MVTIICNLYHSDSAVVALYLCAFNAQIDPLILDQTIRLFISIILWVCNIWIYSYDFIQVRGVDAVSSLTSWQSSTVGVGMMVKSLAERTSKINLNKLHRFQDAGLENDELIETTESLQSLYECYSPQDSAFWYEAC